MFPKLFKITSESFGLDLSDRSIKIAKLSKRGAGFVLENFGKLALEEGLINDGAIVSEKRLAAMIIKSIGKLKSGKIPSKYVSCSLPEQKSFLRVIQLPQVEEGEIEDAIRWEIEANIPMKLSDVYFDWQIIPALHKKVSHFDILVSSAPRDLVDSYTKLLIKAGLKPLSLEPESLAIARCLIKSGISEKPVLIVDLGQTHTSFIIYAGYGIRFSSSTPISGNMITEGIMRNSKISLEKAEHLKREVGFDQNNGEVFEVIAPILTDLKEQIEKYLDFYSEHEAHIHDGKLGISKILLSGGGARLKGLDKYLGSVLKLPVSIADPFVNIRNPFFEKDDFIKYATAFGLIL